LRGALETEGRGSYIASSSPLPRIERADSTERADRADSTARADRADSTARAERADSTERAERADSTARAERADSTERADRADSTARAERADSTALAERADSTERADLASIDRADRAEIVFLPAETAGLLPRLPTRISDMSRPVADLIFAFWDSVSLIFTSFAI